MSLYRNLGDLQDYVGNKARPEESIAEGYIMIECLTFISMYLCGIEIKFNRDDRNYEGVEEKQGKLSLFSHKVRPFGYLETQFLIHTVIVMLLHGMS